MQAWTEKVENTAWLKYFKDAPLLTATFLKTYIRLHIHINRTIQILIWQPCYSYGYEIQTRTLPVSEATDNTFMHMTGCHSIQPRIWRKWDIVTSWNIIKKIRKRVAQASDVWLLAVFGIIHDVQVTHLIVVGMTAK